MVIGAVETLLVTGAVMLVEVGATEAVTGASEIVEGATVTLVVLTATGATGTTETVGTVATGAEILDT